MSEWERTRRGRVILEDDAALVLDKPAGISVMGERHAPDLVSIAAQAGEELFPVHRIDKVTSGAVLFARQLRWHGGLTRQFGKRTAGRAYLAVARSPGLPAHGSIDLPLSVGRKGRIRVAALRDSITADPAGHAWAVPRERTFTHVRSYPSLTEFATLWQDGRHALLVAWPVTGRRHQIRVHLAWIGHPVEGDPLFGMAGEPRALLHSWRLAFSAAWRDGARLEVEATPGPDFWAAVAERLPPGGPEPLLGRGRALTAERLAQPRAAPLAGTPGTRRRPGPARRSR